ncbi:MAG: amidohydrolase [Cytophagales bacterium]|nr:amidohydrolase [Cytophagales bacterium]
MKVWTLSLIFLTLIISCGEKETADLVLLNGKIYTVNATNDVVEAVAVKDGKIWKVGGTDEISALIGEATEQIDLEGQATYPGLIEGHAHIMGVGQNLINVDLMGTKSYQELVDAVAARAEETPEGEWIIGRGWHQDKWDKGPENIIKGFPTHDLLSEAVPNHPVWLKHASGHAGLANAKAMEAAGINQDSPDPSGGEIFKGLGGQPTGIFNETAQGSITAVIPPETKERRERVLKLALESCAAHGITGFHQAGSPSADIDLFKEFKAKGDLSLRLHVMLSGRDEALLNDYFENGPVIDSIDQLLNIRAVKLYSDGALGSRGAWLLEEYSDAPGKFGHNVTPMEVIEDVTMRATAAGFQVCTHAIGDRGNREVLDIYEKAFKTYPEQTQDHRFRIEHAQHLSGADIPRFASLGVVPAMQAIHMSSDRPWAIGRLGRARILEGAYVWRKLLDLDVKIVNGTDAPVEPISPFASFYASISRKTLQGTPDGGYEPDQKMTREQALRSYTLDAAYGAFQEEVVGSIEVGKFADFTVLDRDIMTIDEAEVLKTKATMTIVGGKVVYKGI